MTWMKQKLAIAKYYWRWCWMSRADRKQRKAMQKMLFNLLSNAPMDKIIAGESCSWNPTPQQREGTKEGVTEYVKAVKGEDVKWAGDK